VPLVDAQAASRLVGRLVHPLPHLHGEMGGARGEGGGGRQGGSRCGNVQPVLSSSGPHCGPAARLAQPFVVWKTGCCAREGNPGHARLCWRITRPGRA
jgi:hypothetical protein